MLHAFCIAQTIAHIQNDPKRKPNTLLLICILAVSSYLVIIDTICVWGKVSCKLVTANGYIPLSVCLHAEM